jgi:hypothetical protein
MSLIKQFNSTAERGFVPYRRLTPCYKTLAEEAQEFEKRKESTSIAPQFAYLSKKVAELEDACTRLQQQLAATRVEFDMPAIKKICRLVPLEEQIKTYYHGLTTEEDRKLLLSKRRDAQTVEYRTSIIQKLREFGATNSTIGRMLCRDHGTIMHLERAFKRKQAKKYSNEKVVGRRLERIAK